MFRSPRKRATQSSAGRAQSASGVATCASRPSRRIATRSPSANASPTSCVTCTTVSDSRSNRSRRSSCRRRRSGPSSEPSGSSSSRTSGRVASARASATRCASPPERVVTTRFSAPARPTSSSASVTRERRACSSSPATFGPNPTLPATSRWGKSAASWNTSPTPRRYGGTSVTSRSSRSTRPVVGGWSPATTRRSVDFPEPLGPSTANRSPEATSTETSSRIRAPARVTPTPSRASFTSDAVRRGSARRRARQPSPGS